MLLQEEIIIEFAQDKCSIVATRDRIIITANSKNLDKINKCIPESVISLDEKIIFPNNNIDISRLASHGYIRLQDKNIFYQSADKFAILDIKEELKYIKIYNCKLLLISECNIIYEYYFDENKLFSDKVNSEIEITNRENNDYVIVSYDNEYYSIENHILKISKYLIPNEITYYNLRYLHDADGTINICGTYFINVTSIAIFPDYMAIVYDNNLTLASNDKIISIIYNGTQNIPSQDSNCELHFAKSVKRIGCKLYVVTRNEEIFLCSGINENQQLQKMQCSAEFASEIKK